MIKIKKIITFDSLVFISICISFIGIPFSGSLAVFEHYAKLAVRAFGEFYFTIRFLMHLPQYSVKLQISNILILLYILLAISSILYSPHPWNSGLRGLELLGAYFAVSVMVYKCNTWEDVDNLLNCIYFSLFILMSFVGFFLWLMPAQTISYLNIMGDEPRLGGDIINPNALGLYAGLLFIGSLHHIIRKEAFSKIWYGLLIVSFIILFLSKSRTAIIGTLLSASLSYLIYSFTTNKSITLRILLGIFLLSGVICFYYENLVGYFVRGESEGLILKATGRVDLWIYLLKNQFLRNPVIGSGFLMLSDIPKAFYRGKHALYLASAHNGFIQALIGLGLVGFLLLTIPLTNSFFFYLKRTLSKNFLNKNNSLMRLNLMSQFLSIYILIIIHSFFETGIGGPLSPVIMTFYFLVILSSYFNYIVRTDNEL